MEILFDNYKITDKDRITVITGNNGSGKTRAINLIKSKLGANNQNYIVLDCDSHNRLNINDLKKFAADLKEKSQTKQVIIATLRDEIIEIADRVITLEDRQ